MSAPIELKDPVTHRKPKWPLMGYAPGDYLGRCTVCQGEFLDLDKRAWHCLPCAVEAANERVSNLAKELQAVRQENHTLRRAIQIVSPSPSEVETAGEGEC